MNTRTLKKAFCLMGCLLGVITANGADLRPPSVPLVACDPYFSIWSPADALTGAQTVHWTGKPYPLTSLVRVDGQAYRLMGPVPSTLPIMEQTNLEVLPTRTIYTFKKADFEIKMTFMQPALPDDIDLMSRPVTYLTWSCSSTEGKEHDVQVYFDAGTHLVVNEADQDVVWAGVSGKGLKVLKAGSTTQNVLGRKGDGVRIDWGYLYLAATAENTTTAIEEEGISREAFARHGTLNGTVLKDMPRRVNSGAPMLAMAFDLDKVSSDTETCQVVLAYDDIESILYFGKRLKAYWKKDGKTIGQLIDEAVRDYPELEKRCAQFDKELMQDLYDAGGSDYQKIGALAYRQALGGNKIAVDGNGMPLMFSKENFSNGCMGTVDVFYPFAPQVLLLNPTLAKASFVPILEYGRSERWKFPFAPHDIGTYPHALGQVYGGGERTEDNQMPVEECGNMILLVAGVVEAEQDIAFAKQYWDVLTTWAEYLKSKGLDPENQLCTDDFAGHLAHNVNLSVKAIVALGAYSKMADMMGDSITAAKYRQTAEAYVKQWMKMADDGDHYRLAFDRAGSWSQKYNLVWDRLLDLNLFPESVAKKEMAYYRKMQKAYGLPLDNRKDYTKLDWIVWTATITGEKDDFEALIAPIVNFLNVTPQRVPMTDWYWTHNATHRGFQARPVVGGVFIKLMDNREVWNKWVANADAVRGTWAPLPKPPKIVDVVPTSQDDAQKWYYTFSQPEDGWMSPDFKAERSGWREGKGGFGSDGTPGAVNRTKWTSSDIWMCRTFNMNSSITSDLHLMVYHDEDAEIYINGKLFIELHGYNASYSWMPLTDSMRKMLKHGKNTIAIHCHQTGGGQYIDAGFARVIEQE